jgi:hypothetical protein
VYRKVGNDLIMASSYSKTGKVCVFNYNAEAKYHLRYLGHREQYDINAVLIEIEGNNMNWIHVALERVQQRAVVNTVMNIFNNNCAPRM